MSSRRYRFSLLLATCLTAAPLAAAPIVAVAADSAPSSYVDDLVQRASAILKSTGTDRDVSLAVALLLEAIRSNNTAAMRILAGVLAAGDTGVAADPARAEELLKQSIAIGDIGPGEAALADLYMLDTPLKDTAKAAAAYQRAVDHGNTDAMIKLAAMLTAGSDVPKDVRRAEALLKQAVGLGAVALGSDRLADLYRNDPTLKDPAAAAAAYQAAADTGNTSSMKKLAVMLTNGEGIPADPPRAEALLQKAITAGDTVDGYAALGDFYSAPTPSADGAKAAAAYERAIDGGNTYAMLRLATMLMNGTGVAASPERAEALAQKAADAGQVNWGQNVLGDLYSGDNPLKNPRKAAAAYAASANAGNTDSMRKLAKILTLGDGVPAEPAHAEALIQKAIEAGDTQWGFLALGNFYAAPTPLKDMTKAVQAYEQAIDAGSVPAMEQLGWMLTTGNGVPADPGRAETILQKAVAAGDATAGGFLLGNLYMTAGPLQNSTKAAAAYEKSADAGHTGAMLTLAAMLIKGDGVSSDPVRAEGLIQKAIAGGEVSDGAYALGELYSAETPLKDEAKATAAYEQAATAGNPHAHLVLAKLQAKDPLDPETLKSMAEHFASAEPALGKELVLDAIFQLPPQPLVGMVQQSLTDSGIPVPPTGEHSKLTAAAIAKFCKKRSVVDCNPNFLTRSLVAALIFRSSSS